VAQSSTAPGTLNVPRSWDNEKDHRAKLADAINRALQGKLNNTGSVTLTANSATTTLTDPRIGKDSVILIQPTTANAATATGNVYFGTPGNGTVTINHTNNAQTDRTFKYVIIG
jgi:hypothetical protein